MSSSPRTDLRERVHAKVDELCLPNGLLSVGGPLDSARLHSYDGKGGRWRVQRARLHADLLRPYRQPQMNARLGGRCAVATAGPPAAGKSSAVASVLGDVTGWRVIDADEFKRQLIARSLQDDPRTYQRVLDRRLPDGETIMPLELAGLFHLESTTLARRALAYCLRSGEDVVVEGTLQWQGLVAEYSEALARASYESLIVVDLVTPLAVALERAKSRWWEGRLTGGMGGRFTPTRSIESLYDQPDGRSRCSVNARDLVSASQQRGLDATLQVIISEPPEPEDEARSA